MSEGLANSGSLESAALRAGRQYERTAQNVLARRELYDFADPPIYLPPEFQYQPSVVFDSEKQRLSGELLDIEEAVIDVERRLSAMVYANGLSKEANGVDMGCGNNAYLWYNFIRHGHTGKTLGMDKFYPRKVEQQYLKLSPDRNTPVSRLVGSAEDLTKIVGESSLDVIFAKGLLYHVANPLVVLDEFYKALKPGGILAVITRGSNNMRRLWGYHSFIGAQLRKNERLNDLQIGHPFYLDFDIEPHRLALSQRFEIIDYFEQSQNPRPRSEVTTIEPPVEDDFRLPEQLSPTYLRIGGKQGWQSTYMALTSLINDFKFPPGVGILDQFEAVDTIIHEYIRPDFDRETARNDHFGEYVEQAIFICRKPA